LGGFIALPPIDEASLSGYNVIVNEKGFAVNCVTPILFNCKANKEELQGDGGTHRLEEFSSLDGKDKRRAIA